MDKIETSIMIQYSLHLQYISLYTIHFDAT